MRRGVGVGVVVGLLLAAVCLPAHAVLLRYTPEVGAANSYSYTMAMYMSGNAGESPIKMDMTTEATFDQKVLEKTEEGTKVEASMHDGTMHMKITLPGASEPTEQSPPFPDMTFTTVMDERGKMKKFESSGGPSMGPSANDMMSAMSGFAMLPKADVKPGDTWTDTVKTQPTGMMPGMQVTVTSRLLEVAPYEGHPCAKIQVSFKGTMSGGDKSPLGAGKMQGTGLQYYDYEKSVWVSQQGQAAITMQVSAPGQTTPMAMKMAMNYGMKLKQ